MRFVHGILFILFEAIINFIMKLQNLDEIRQQLFNDQVKLTPKLKIKKQSFLLKIPLFDLIYQKKGDHNFQMILENIKLIKTQLGEVIFQNLDQRSFNFILKGTIVLSTRTKSQQKNQHYQKPKFYKQLQSGQHFGQKMQYGKQHLESARSVTPCYLLQLPMNLFYITFSGHFKYDQLKEKINFLQSIWIFNQVKRTLLERILLSSQCNKYTRNTVLNQPGNSATHLLVILDGQVTLKLMKQGKAKPFCVLTKGEVCGLEEIMDEKLYEYSAICTSDFVEVLKVEKQIMVDIVDRDIKPQLLNKKKNLALQLKLKNLDSKKLIMYSQKQLVVQQITPEKTKFLSHRKRYKSQGGTTNQPIDRVKVLNQLFKREVQLKQAQLRRYKLQSIEQAQKSLHHTNRISTYTNNSCTYDKQIIVKYLGRKQKKYQDILRKQREFIEKRITILPQFKVQRSSAVKNQKRKLKHSRKHFYSTLQIYQ